MGKIREKFQELRKQGRKAFIPYITFGFPDIKKFESIILTLDKTGADFIEIGLPFSDPIADGPIIQTSSKIALDKGANIYNLLSCLRRIKKKLTKSRLILMSYYNPIYNMGLDRFFDQARPLIEGVIIADLLAEESQEFVKKARKNNVDTIFFISPTTQDERLKFIDKLSSGFIYYISVTGVTGPRQSLPREILVHIKKIKKKLTAPVCIGFGISNQKQARQFKKIFDGVIVGSALIKKILNTYKRRDFLRQFKEFVLWLNG